MRFDKDIGDPPSISRTAVLITSDSVTPPATGARDPDVDTHGIPGQATPLSSAPTHGLVDSLGAGDDPGDTNIAEYKLTLPDLDARPEAVAGIQAGAHVTVAFGPGAGLKNPTEAGSGDKVSVGLSTQGTFASDNIVVPLVLEIDDVKDKRDTPITITGKGFKNGTTATIWVEKMTEGNMIGVRDENEIDIISVDVASDDTFEVTINVSVPPFEKGSGNLINAIDGEQPTPNTFKEIDKLLKFHVDDSIVISPTTANVGDTVRVQVRDWPETGSIADPDGMGLVRISNIPHGPISLTVDELGNATFDIVIQNGVPVGRSELRLDDGPNDAEASIVIGGANLTVRPETVVPNQSVLVTGRGFSRGGKINGPAPSDSDADGDNSLVSLSGNSNGLKAKGGAQSARINADETIDVDSGGNWSANIVIPMTSTSVVPSAGTTASVLELKIADDDGREGTVDLSISPRSITLNPAESRVGTDITVTGTGFPADNPATEADTVPVVNIEYNVGGTNPWCRLGSVQPDSSGSFTGTFRVPSTAVLPSTNTVRAHFTITEENADGTSVNLPYESTAVHNVPEGGISLSIAEGTPGTEVTVTGQGFKAFRTLESIEFGILEVTPAPKPITNATGGFATAFVVPGLDVGTHNVEVTISETVASAPFRILAGDAPVTPEVMMAEAATPDVAFAAVIAEDNLIAVYHFDPATQNEAPNYGYTVYDARPLFMSGNNLDSIEPGQFYTVQVSEDQMGVTLGSQTVDLYAPFTPIRW